MLITHLDQTWKSVNKNLFFKYNYIWNLSWKLTHSLTAKRSLHVNLRGWLITTFFGADHRGVIFSKWWVWVWPLGLVRLPCISAVAPQSTDLLSIISQLIDMNSLYGTWRIVWIYKGEIINHLKDRCPTCSLRATCGSGWIWMWPNTKS